MKDIGRTANASNSGGILLILQPPNCNVDNFGQNFAKAEMPVSELILAWQSISRRSGTL